MLVLSRKVNQAVRIGADVEVTVVAVQGGKVRLAFAAPRDVPIVRTELLGARKEHSHARTSDPTAARGRVQSAR